MSVTPSFRAQLTNLPVFGSSKMMRPWGVKVLPWVTPVPGFGQRVSA